jgi:uncharacterized protein (TIGR01244 family)
MNRIVQITPHFAVTGALRPDDLAEAARQGFRSVLSNLPDGELRTAPSSAQEGELAAGAGLGFRHIPVPRAEVFSVPVVSQMRAVLGLLDPPILAHCASGQRSALAWAAAAASCQSADRVLAVLAAAGFDFEPLRAELEGLAGAWGGAIPTALDVAYAAPPPGA